MRCKDLTVQLQEQVATLKEEKGALEHQIEVTGAKMQFLERQNMLLITSQQSQSLAVPTSLLTNSQSYRIDNSSQGGAMGIDQALLSLSNLPYMQSTRGFPGISNMNLTHYSSAALANLDPPLGSILSPPPSATRGQPPPI